MAKKKPRVPGTYRASPDSTRRVAIHEAGHAVVAHALGLRPVEMRVGAVTLPPGHPDNPTDQPFRFEGSHRSEPAMAIEVFETAKRGEPLTPAQHEWALQTFVVDFAGPLAESSVQDDAALRRAAEADFDEAGKLAQVLGRSVKKGEKYHAQREFWFAGQDIAEAILIDRRQEMVALAQELALHAPAALGEESLTLLFAQFGNPLGSHRHLLDELDAVPPKPNP